MALALNVQWELMAVMGSSMFVASLNPNHVYIFRLLHRLEVCSNKTVHYLLVLK